MPTHASNFRLSLTAKVLLGLLLNLAVVGATFTGVLVLQIRLNPGWLLAGQAGDRLRTVADLLAGDLERAAPAEVLERYREAWQLDFMLFDRGGREVTGDTNPVPWEVAAELNRPRADPASRNPAPGRRNAIRPRRGNLDALPGEPGSAPGPNAFEPVEPGPPREPESQRADRGLDGSRPESAEGRVRAGRGVRGPQEDVGGLRLRGGQPRPGLRPGPAPPTVIRAGQPASYWILLPLPPHGPEPTPGLTLVVRARSLWSGGFLLDPRPWVLAGTGALLLSVLFWLPIVRRITRDVGRMTTQTEEIAAGRFETRLELSRNDELGRLADAIDQMAARLAHHVAGQRRFLGDAAHELSSPIARMQTVVAILETRPPAEHGAYLRDLSEELDEMAGLVNELLAFSRALHGRAVRLEPVELRPLLDRAWAREGRAEVVFHNEVAAGLAVQADSQLLFRAVANLLRNAVRYAGHAGPITAAARPDSSGIALVIADVGPGVPPEALPRLFEPFFRPEDSRARELGGAGLGLAIVKTCVDACQGTVGVANRSPAGFEVTLRLPGVRNHDS